MHVVAAEARGQSISMKSLFSRGRCFRVATKGGSVAGRGPCACRGGVLKSPIFNRGGTLCVW
jgi:hypothetical protein